MAECFKDFLERIECELNCCGNLTTKTQAESLLKKFAKRFDELMVGAHTPFGDVSGAVIEWDGRAETAEYIGQLHNYDTYYVSDFIPTWNQLKNMYAERSFFDVTNGTTEEWMTVPYDKGDVINMANVGYVALRDNVVVDGVNLPNFWGRWF